MTVLHVPYSPDDRLMVGWLSRWEGYPSREQKMLNGNPPRVIYHQVCLVTYDVMYTKMNRSVHPNEAELGPTPNLSPEIQGQNLAVTVLYVATRAGKTGDLEPGVLPDESYQGIALIKVACLASRGTGDLEPEVLPEARWSRDDS